MESTARPGGSGQASGGRWLLVVLAAVMMASLVAAPGIRAQDTAETPDVVIPGTGDEGDAPAPATPEPAPDVTPEDEPTVAPAPEELETPAPTSALIDISATDPGNPAVIAHGLAFLTGDQTVWQVREVAPASGADAAAVVSNAAFVYQVQGRSVIRNDVTGKRAMLSPGESYFKAGGDPYTTFANTADSVVWIFELVSPSAVEADAFYESPLIDDYSEGVFDLLMVRYVLGPGESATLPDHTGPALVMSTDGDIDIESGGLGLLGTGDGQLITEGATVTNNSANPAVFVMPAFGLAVDDSTSSPGPTVPEPAADATDAEPVETEAEPVDDPGTTAADEPEAADPPVADDTTAEDPVDSGTGSAQTSINITAQVELYVVVVADGVTVFDGPIPDGGQSGVIVGSTFEVYTTVGAGTLFSNACGEDFYMGFEQGEANYTLSASPDSCAP